MASAERLPSTPQSMQACCNYGVCSPPTSLVPFLHRPGAMTDDPMTTGRHRLSTGVPGLDPVLGGGLLAGGIYLLTGGPGTGKTVIANQICFNHARQGGRCLYVTLLSESHSRLLANLETLRFFDPSLLTDQFSYLSATKTLRDDSLDVLFELVQQEVRQRNVDLLVLDGLRVGFPRLKSSRHQRTAFFNRLAALLEFSNCTAVLCAFSQPGTIAPEHALADALLELTQQRKGYRVLRELVVTKLRGSRGLEGSHSFEIDERGAVVHPRYESLVAREGQIPQATTGRSPLGVSAIDQMLTGGIPSGTTTALIGATGSGKTLLGLHFLAHGARHNERSLYFGFHDGPERTIQQGDGIGLALAQLSDADALDIVWKRPYETLIDPLVHQLVDHVSRRGIRRLFIDGIEGIARNNQLGDRGHAVCLALVQQLSAAGVTTAISIESPLMRSELDAHDTPWSAFFANAILLSYAQHQHELHREIRIIKMRNSGFDASARQFTITSHGFQLAHPVSREEREP